MPREPPRRLATPLLTHVTLALLLSSSLAAPAPVLKLPGCIGGCLGLGHGASASTHAGHSLELSSHLESARAHPLETGAGELAHGLRAIPQSKWKTFKVGKAFGKNKGPQAELQTSSSAGGRLEGLASAQEVTHGPHRLHHSEPLHSSPVHTEPSTSPPSAPPGCPSLQRLSSGRERHENFGWTQEFGFDAASSVSHGARPSRPVAHPSLPEPPTVHDLLDAHLRSHSGMPSTYGMGLSPIEERTEPSRSALTTPMRSILNSPRGSSFGSSSSSRRLVWSAPLQSLERSSSSGLAIEKGGGRGTSSWPPSPGASRPHGPKLSEGGSLSNSQRLDDGSLHASDGSAHSSQRSSGSSPPHSPHWSIGRPPSLSRLDPVPSFDSFHTAYSHTPLVSPSASFGHGWGGGGGSSRIGKEEAGPSHVGKDDGASTSTTRRPKLWQLMNLRDENQLGLTM